MKIYGYEQFIPGGTNNLHFTDIRHPFLGTSRYLDKLTTIVNLHYYNLYNLP
jgi:hypothetical protein